MEKIYLRTGYMDMRKQLDDLADIIQYSFQLDPYSNSLFLFCGKRADRIKAVHYEGDGFCWLFFYPLSYLTLTFYALKMA